MAVPTDTELARLAWRVAKKYLAARESLSTAESCTGGFIAKLLTDIAGSSEWFDGGVVCYSNAAKRWQLRVPASTLARYGAVSRATARAMALGLLTRSRADCVIAVTGIAGPTGAVPGKPVGTVWFGFARRSGAKLRVRTIHKRFRGGRDAVRRHAVALALRQLAGP